MEQHLKRVGVVLLTIGMTYAVHAELQVLYDGGGTPLKSYIKKDNRQVDPPAPRAPRNLSEAIFPVVTKSMSVGRVGPDEGNIDAPVILRPMFIIGDDPDSLRWLTENRELLAERKAIGMVVNVATAERFRDMQRIAGNRIALNPVSGDDVAESLKIRHYPFYIDSNGVLR